jgi:hypothetical protein
MPFPVTASSSALQSQQTSKSALNLFSSALATASPAEDPLNNRHSASDWLYNVRSLPQSKVLREIRHPVLAVAAWSFVVSVVHRFALQHYPTVARHMCIPGTAHSFVVSALGLLLVFRTNSAYQRFNVSQRKGLLWPSRATQRTSAGVGVTTDSSLGNLMSILSSCNHAT